MKKLLLVVLLFITLSYTEGFPLESEEEQEEYYD
jgi:hypothetical protein